MDKFIHVFTIDAKEKLLKANYKLLKSDDKNSIYTFENKASQNFVLNGISYIQSNVLTF